MTHRPIFIMGTSSGAGKTTVVMALCRILREMGYSVAPFKAQNMSLNSGVGMGGEMAYAQVLQARACGKVPDVRMNPVLLKPEMDRTHVVINGRYAGTYDGKDYMLMDKESIFKMVLEDFRYLLSNNDIIIVEGAGSPAEINLKNDIANIRLAREIGSKNILVADIDRGGAFASIAGTVELLGRDIFSGYIFNKFRGNEELLEEGIRFLHERYGLNHYGTIPYMDIGLPQEDSLWSWQGKGGKILVSIVRLPHISNSTDFHIFYRIRGVGINFANSPEDLERSDIVIIPGSKLTVNDLLYLRREGFEDKINNLWRDGVPIIGICGGYQMLGRYIIDNFESRLGKVVGMNILDSKTEFTDEKIVSLVEGRFINGPFKGEGASGYEIHFGRSRSDHPLIAITRENGKDVLRYDGEYGKNAFGTYMHDIFLNKGFTEKIINSIADSKGLERIRVDYSLESDIENIAREIGKHLKVDLILDP
ncbi:MAG: cobyric acid synthase [Thermoplasmata archaeon]|nr:MAG: cobyric acid synthase [Aciduliprofundum sp.]